MAADSSNLDDSANKGSHLREPKPESSMPEVVIAPVAHEGDPVPGMLGVTYSYIWDRPRIDGAGNVLFQAYIDGPGISGGNDLALFYGPPGGIEVLIREGDPAPGFESGVIVLSLYYGWPALSESGWAAFNAKLSGPGIAAGVNDRAMFAGPPGDIQKVYQLADPVPGFEPGAMDILVLPKGLKLMVLVSCLLFFSWTSPVT